MSRRRVLLASPFLLGASIVALASPGVAQSHPLLASVGVAPGLTPAFLAQPALQGPLQESPGKTRRKGALWGGGIGLVAVGLLAGLSVDAEEEGAFGELVEAAVTPAAVLAGAVLGAGIGALLGATVFAPSHSPGAGNAILVAPTVSGVQARVRLRFR